MKVTLRQLQVFDAVASFGGVMAAAEKLGMSQSAASGALKDLQIILRRPLFRSAKGRPLQMTEEGMRLQPLIRSLLNEAAELERAPDVTMQGKLVVGATDMIAETLLPELCIKFRKLHPGVQITILAEPTEILHGRLGRLELETALIEFFPDMPGIELVKWRSDELWLVVSPDHPLAASGPLRIRDLAHATWCLREATASSTVRLRVLLHEEMGLQQIGLEATNNQAVRLAAKAGGGIACLSKYMVTDDVEAGQLVRLNVRDFKFTRLLTLARPKAMRRSLIAAAFDQFLLEQADAA